MSLIDQLRRLARRRPRASRIVPLDPAAAARERAALADLRRRQHARRLTSEPTR